MKNKKTLVVILVIGLAIGGYYYYQSKKGKTLSKSEMIDYIISSNNAAFTTGDDINASKKAMLSYEDGYILAWYNAALNLQEKFSYNNNSYFTKGGGKATR